MRTRVAIALALAGCDLAFPIDPPKAPDAPSDVLCPPSYVSFGGTTRYRIDLLGRAWLDAEQACAADVGGGGQTHLAVLDDLGELAVIHSQTSNDDVWIGLSDRRVPGTFQTVSRQVTAFPEDGSPAWATGEPDGLGDCVVVQRLTGRLDDVDCIRLHASVCECDTFAEAPGNF